MIATENADMEQRLCPNTFHKTIPDRQTKIHFLMKEKKCNFLKWLNFKAVFAKSSI